MDTPASGRHHLLNWLSLPVLLIGLLITGLAATSVHRLTETVATRLLVEQHHGLTTLLREQIAGLVAKAELLAATTTNPEHRSVRRAREWLTQQPGFLALEVREGLPLNLRPMDNRVVSATILSDIRQGGGRATVSTLFIPAESGHWLNLTIDPTRWLKDRLLPLQVTALDIQVHDLSQHTKSPLIQRSAEGALLRDKALRSELAFGSRTWMLTTTPTHDFFSSVQPVQTVWFAGVLTSLLAAIVVGLLARRLIVGNRRTVRAQQTNARLGRQMDNSQVEKSILKQALNNSELRSRDLVELIGGFVCEMNENLTVIYISPQVVELLGRPPAEVAEQPFEQWVAPDDLTNFKAAVVAARQEKHMERIDLHLLNKGTPVATTLRIKAVSDPISGCTGYRMTAQLSVP